MKPTSPASNGNSAFATLVLPTVSGIKRMLLDKGAYRKRFVATGPNRKAISSACQRGPAPLLINIAPPMRDNTKLGGRDDHSPGDGEA